jgi:NAD(P)-dependent dehydrogenase (short-subunit alcohol dehydrogenase family)
MSKLSGKTAVVTGGSSGIGFAIAERFAREGARVFITGRRAAELQAAAARIGEAVEAVPGDVTSMEDLDRLYELVRAGAGSLDVLVASSGVAEQSPLDTVTEAHFDTTFGINTRALLFTVQKALPLMGRGGSVVLIGSIAGVIGTPGYGVYGATKAAVRSYARTWTNELAARGIRVNTLSPGPIDTPMFDKAPAETRKAIEALVPLGRFGRPEEVAAAALFLASDESTFVAGAELCIDGGMAQV